MAEADPDRKKTVAAIEGTRRFISQARGAQFDCRRIRNARGIDNELVDRFEDHLKSMEKQVDSMRQRLMENLADDEQDELKS